MKINRKKATTLLAMLLITAAVSGSALYLSLTHTTIQQTLLRPLLPHQTSLSPTPPGQPTLQRLEVVTNQAFGVNNDYVPNGWGVHKNRVIRLSNGDVFTVYISAGQDERNREWHLMRRNADGTWEEMNSGNAGAEPVNILRGPNDEIHLFTWPGTAGKAVHLMSTDEGKTFTSETLPGQWYVDQGYSGCTIDDKGNIIFFETAQDKPGNFLWAYYDATTAYWQFHSVQTDYRYTYAFFFLNDDGSLSITAMRDALRPELGYPNSTPGSFDYIFNEIKYFHVNDVNNPQLTSTLVAAEQPRNNTDYDITYITDSYMDTLGRIHILYDNLYDGPHHAIIQNGQVIKDVKMNISSPTQMRIVQDTSGHFYIITMDESGNSIDVYPGAAKDTDGTQLESAVKLDISKYPGCTDYDFCHSPTFTVPRGGNALSDYIDGTYGNYDNEFYFRISLRDSRVGMASQQSTTVWFLPFVPIILQQAVLEEKSYYIY
ncbi:MAG TPA: hypothetical protein VH593_12655 [Ktedonobacteraceae bacterium]